MTVVREDQIDKAVDLLRQYQSAKASDAGDLDAEETEIIRRHRVERAKLALENMGIEILPPLLALSTPRIEQTAADFAWDADGARGVQ